MQFSEEAPLGDLFYNNPYEYLQNYVKNMNNEMFLSQYQINNLYALLLIGRGCPWDGLRTSSPGYKQQVDGLVNNKINDVKSLLDGMSQLYEDKAKKATFSQIQRLMSILKAKKKSIYIQKVVHCQRHPEGCQGHAHGGHQHQLDNQDESNQTRDAVYSQQQGNQPSQHHASSVQPAEQEYSDRPQQPQHAGSQSGPNMLQSLSALPYDKQIDETQVFGMIQGLGNIPNLSSLALGNCLEYNTSQRYIKFKMSKSYVMTIKNDDPVAFDLTSALSVIPGNLFVHHVFPYLTALQLFSMRGVCKQWLGYVKQSWHATFKREMYVQLLAGQFCKDIQFFYKCIQLRNPFFQKLSLLLHALIQIIQWDSITVAIQQNTINMPFKRVLMVLLKLLGDGITINNFNDLNEELWQMHRSKMSTLKQQVVQFFSTFSGNSMTINELRQLKINLFDHPFMRADQMQTEEKTPLLLLIFVKQLNLQQILKNHLHFSQEYLLNSKKRLDHVAAKTPHQRGLLEGIYKILLLKTMNPKENEDVESDQRQMPGFHEMVEGVLTNKQSDEPDFYIRTRSTSTSIYMDRATKLDIIISTLRKLPVESFSANIDNTQNSDRNPIENSDETSQAQIQTQQSDKNISTHAQTSQPMQKQSSTSNTGCQTSKQPDINGNNIS